MKKVCTKCNIKKAIEEFVKDKNAIDGIGYNCKDCASSIRRKYYHANKGKEQLKAKESYQRHKQKISVYYKDYYQINKQNISLRRKAQRIDNPLFFKRKDLQKKYKITLEQKEAMWLAQDKKCKICKRNILLWPAHVDHDHITSKVRGLLCNFCNTGIGFLQEDVTVLQAAITYLELSRSSQIRTGIQTFGVFDANRYTKDLNRPKK